MKRFLAILLWLAFASSAWGAVAFDTTSTFIISGASSGSQAHVVTGTNPFLGVCVTMENGVPTTVSSVAYNSVSLTLKASLILNSGGIDQVVELWYLANPATGSNSLAVTLSGSANAHVAGVSLTGVDTAPLGTHGINSGTAAATSSAVVTGVANGMVFNCFSHSEPTEIVTHAGHQTERINADTGAWRAVVTTSTSTGSVSMDETFADSGRYAHIAVPVNPVITTASQPRAPIVFQ